MLLAALLLAAQEAPVPLFRDPVHDGAADASINGHANSTAPAPAALREHPEWFEVQSVIMIYRECVRGGKESSEVSFYISSLPPKGRLRYEPGG